MTLRIGAGIGDITPAVPVALAGFGARTELADHITDPLEVRAIVVDDGTTIICLLSFDSLGLADEVADIIAARVSDAIGIAPDKVLATATHTHAAPCAMPLGAALGWPIPDGYIEQLAGAAAAAASAAVAARALAHWRWSEVELSPEFGHDRRLGTNPLLHAYRVRAVGVDGSTVATIVNIGIHPVVLGPAWRGVATDFVGPLRSTIDARLGGTSLVLQHGLGNINPLAGPAALEAVHAGNPLETAITLGRNIGNAVSAANDTPLEEGPVHLSWETVTVTAQDTVLATLLPEPRSVPLVRGNLGGVPLIGVPGEPFASVNAALRADGRPLLVASLAPSWHGYIPMPFTQGYEESVSLGAEAVGTILARIQSR